MGLAHEDVGRIGYETEGSGDWFTIHAGYGYRPARARVSQLQLKTQFTMNGRIWKISLIALDRVEATEIDSGATRTFYVREEQAGGLHSDPVVELVGREEHDPDHPLGWWWRENAHPPFMIADIPDLIAVLNNIKEAASV